MAAQGGQQREELKLSQAVEQVLQECRMVLPGIQALFGFQLVAVFDKRFELLSPGEQAVHLAALVLVALSAGLVMAPAAYHRQTCPHEVTAFLVTLATRLITVGMLLLAVGICLDVYLIARLILGGPELSIVLTLALLAILLGLWYGLPLWRPGSRSPAARRTARDRL